MEKYIEIKKQSFGLLNTTLNKVGNFYELHLSDSSAKEVGKPASEYNGDFWFKQNLDTTFTVEDSDKKTWFEKTSKLTTEQKASLRSFGFSNDFMNITL